MEVKKKCDTTDSHHVKRHKQVASPEMTRKEYIMHSRANKRSQQNADRQAMKHKREKSLKTTYYGILGVDPIAPVDDIKVTSDTHTTKSNQIWQIKARFGLDDHAFGLDRQLFTPKHEFDQLQNFY